MNEETKTKEPLVIQAYERPLYLMNAYEDMKVRTEPVLGAKDDQEAFKAFAKHDIKGGKEYSISANSTLLLQTFGLGKEISKEDYENE